MGRRGGVWIGETLDGIEVKLREAGAEAMGVIMSRMRIESFSIYPLKNISV